MGVCVVTVCIRDASVIFFVMTHVQCPWCSTFFMQDAALLICKVRGRDCNVSATILRYVPQSSFALTLRARLSESCALDPEQQQTCQCQFASSLRTDARTWHGKSAPSSRLLPSWCSKLLQMGEREVSFHPPDVNRAPRKGHSVTDRPRSPAL